MRVRRGEAVSGPEFFGLLWEDCAFCAELGRVTLAAGRLESALKQYVSARVPGSDTDKATLGRLIGYCEKHSCLDRLLPALRMLKEQRNYLIHSIHALLFGLVEETILEGSGLVDSDVATYTERAWQLKEDLLGLAEVVEGA